MANCITRVHHPDITDAERARRMEEIKKATVNFVIAAEEQKRRATERMEAVEG